MTPVSIRPSEMVEGGAVPVDMNLTWKKCIFNLFNYPKKDGTTGKMTTAAKIVYASEDGNEYEQQYSVGDPERFIPSSDGKTLVAIGAAVALSKSSNFFILMSNLINAGFPENKLSDDISTLDGLVTFNIGLPEPKRSGLARATEEGAREKVLSVPSQVLKLPWEKKAKAAVASKAATTESEDEGDEVAALAVKFVEDQLAKSGEDSIERQALAVAVFKDLAKDPNKDAIATYLFSPEMAVAMLAAGHKVEGETFSK